MNYLLVLSFLLLSVAIARADDERVKITLKSDSVLVGSLISNNASSYLLRLETGEIKTVRRTDVKSIETITEARVLRSSLGEFSPGVTSPRVTSPSVGKRDSVHLDKFSCFGGTLGTPAGINARFGGHEGRTAYHVSGMYWGEEIYGIQLDLLFTSSIPKDYTQPYFGLMVGYMNLTVTKENATEKLPQGTYQWTYVGLGLVLHSHSFLFQAGITTGGGDFTSPVLMLQLGIVPRFY